MASLVLECFELWAYVYVEVRSFLKLNKLSIIQDQSSGGMVTSAGNRWTPKAVMFVILILFFISPNKSPFMTEYSPAAA